MALACQQRKVSVDLSNPRYIAAPDTTPRLLQRHVEEDVRIRISEVEDFVKRSRLDHPATSYASAVNVGAFAALDTRAAVDAG
jgi:hypothetical protein